MKINQGGVLTEIGRTETQDATITINLSSIRRHSIGKAWSVSVIDGEDTYIITVERAATEEGKP